MTDPAKIPLTADQLNTARRERQATAHDLSLQAGEVQEGVSTASSLISRAGTNNSKSFPRAALVLLTEARDKLAALVESVEALAAKSE